MGWVDGSFIESIRLEEGLRKASATTSLSHPHWRARSLTHLDHVTPIQRNRVLSFRYLNTLSGTSCISAQ